MIESKDIYIKQLERGLFHAQTELAYLKQVINLEFDDQGNPTLTVRTVADAVQKVLEEWRKDSGDTLSLAFTDALVALRDCQATTKETPNVH